MVTCDTCSRGEHGHTLEERDAKQGLLTVFEVCRQPDVYAGSRKKREPAYGGGLWRPEAPAEEIAFVEGEQTSVHLRN